MTITAPVMICLLASDTPSCARPVWRTAIISTPMKELITLPRPPIRLVPPITQAAIADSSMPMAAFGSALDNREVCARPANPQRAPLITNTAIEYGALRLTRDRNKQVTEVWVRWERRDDLLLSRSGDRHYALDRATGRLTFGGGANVPPAGAPIGGRSRSISPRA